jgi:hypothetical protein
VWRVLVDLQFPVLLVRAESTLLSNEDQHVIPALCACDASAAAAVQQARAEVERLRREQTLRDIELWSGLRDDAWGCVMHDFNKMVRCGGCLLF